MVSLNPRVFVGYNVDIFPHLSKNQKLFDVKADNK